jgi:glycerol-3-phosphate dehydrogenase
MPICREIHEIIYAGKPVRDAVQALMGRELRSESE